MDNKRHQDLFWVIWQNEPIGISSLVNKLHQKVSIPTLNRDLAHLKQSKLIISEGIGPGTKYRVSTNALITTGLDVDTYFKSETDSRKILNKFNPEIFSSLANIHMFSEAELVSLNRSTSYFRSKFSLETDASYKREFERLMIELSWKSSQIEGNTYDLLDTEQLLKYNIPSKNHSVEEATMLLNHKVAIEYIRNHVTQYKELSLGKIIDIHSLLTRDLKVSKDLRKRLVRITGTKYTPPDNQFVIEESVENLCSLINAKENPFEKALLAVLLLSYIQPFEDGNKRTGRLLANALLMAYNMCPLSYRSVTPSDYKKAMLLFYELNNITAFKEIFAAQYVFAVENYF